MDTNLRTSFGTKLRLHTIITTGLALTLACAGVMVTELLTSRAEIVRYLSIGAEYIGAFSTAALDFQDVDAAEDILAILFEDPFIEGAAIYDAEGNLFAAHSSPGQTLEYPAIPHANSHSFAGGKVEMFRMLSRDDQALGTIYLRRSLDDIVSHLWRFGGVVLAVLVAALILTLLTGARMLSSLTRPVTELAATAGAIAKNRDFSMRATKTSTDELGELTDAFNTMLEEVQAYERALKETQDGLEARVGERTAELEGQNRLKTESSAIADRMRGTLEPDELGRNLLSGLCPKVGALVGVMYSAQGPHALQATGSYAVGGDDAATRTFHLGEGLVGQAAAERRRIEIRDLPEDYLTIRSGVGKTPVRVLLIVPIVHEDDLVGVLELGAMDDYSKEGLEVLDAVLPYVGSTLQAAISRKHTRELLEETQRQAAELQQQQEALRVVNEELEEQTRALKRSQEQLQSQQEELQVANEELEEQKQVLEEQKRVLENANQEIEAARKVLQKQTHELAQASQYKSEFLANMSHELRTPLNSLLILSRMLAENKTGNLTKKQVDYAQTIQQSGKDLLDLISDVLDLSKVEAGRLDLHVEATDLAGFRAQIERTFRHMVESKGLKFSIAIDPALPAEIHTDARRLEQILKNLLSNATKFCDRGQVSVNMTRPAPDTPFYQEHLRPETTVAIAVTDSGIGIPEERQAQIFEAFRQADSGISRRYGGTGLGLSISREFARMLGGEIHLDSTEGRGSTFTLYIPEETPSPPSLAPPPGSAPPRAGQSPADSSADGPPSILIVEDDRRFAALVGEVAEQKGYHVRMAHDGPSGLLQAQAADHPFAIILDLTLPGLDGLDVFEQLQQDPATRDIPVHFISAREETPDIRNLGAVGYLQKPVDLAQLEEVFHRIEAVVGTHVRTVLVVEDDPTQQQAICELLSPNIRTMTACTAHDAYELLTHHSFDCMVLDLTLADATSGLDLLKQLQQEDTIHHPPVIIYTGKDLSTEEEEELRVYSESIVLKGDRSIDRLLDEVRLFLHCMDKDPASIPPGSGPLPTGTAAPSFAGHTLLLVDDDMRNVFALTSILEERGANVIVGKNGREGIEQLESHPDTSLILMDIMMPEMDGMEATRAIRSRPEFAELPVIALTAKAMKGDREKCLASGASDYLAKPIDVDRLISMIHVWLQR